MLEEWTLSTSPSLTGAQGTALRLLCLLKPKSHFLTVTNTSALPGHEKQTVASPKQQLLPDKDTGCGTGGNGRRTKLSPRWSCSRAHRRSNQEESPRARDTGHWRLQFESWISWVSLGFGRRAVWLVGHDSRKWCRLKGETAPQTHRGTGARGQSTERHPDHTGRRSKRR